MFGIFKRKPMEKITLNNRNEAEQKISKARRYLQIVEILEEHQYLSAKEIANCMCNRGYTPTNERNFASPRITELLKMGVVDDYGSKKCEWTGHTVTVFCLRKG